jgi:hypothetical protein
MCMRLCMRVCMMGEEQEQEGRGKMYKSGMLDIGSRLPSLIQRTKDTHYHQKDSNHAEVKEAKRTAAGSPRPFKNVRGATRPEVGRSVM